MNLVKKRKKQYLGLADSSYLYTEIIDLFGGLNKISKKRQHKLNAIITKYSEWYKE